MKAAGREADLAVINPSGIFGPLLGEDPGTSGNSSIRFLKGGTRRAAPQLWFITFATSPPPMSRLDRRRAPAGIASRWVSEI